MTNTIPVATAFMRFEQKLSELLPGKRISVSHWFDISEVRINVLTIHKLGVHVAGYLGDHNSTIFEGVGSDLDQLIIDSLIKIRKEIVDERQRTQDTVSVTSVGFRHIDPPKGKGAKGSGSSTKNNRSKTDRRNGGRGANKVRN